MGLGGQPTGSRSEEFTMFFPTRENHVVNSADMIALGDGYQGMFEPGGTNPNRKVMTESRSLSRGGFSYFALWDFYSTKMRDVERRHRGRLNMGFCDGHVEDGKIDAWYFSQKESDVRRWRVDNKAP